MDKQIITVEDVEKGKLKCECCEKVNTVNWHTVYYNSMLFCRNCQAEMQVSKEVKDKLK